MIFRFGFDPEWPGLPDDSDIEVIADSTDRDQDSIDLGEMEFHNDDEEAPEADQEAINARFLNWLSRQIALLEDYLALGHRLTK